MKFSNDKVRIPSWNESCITEFNSLSKSDLIAIGATRLFDLFAIAPMYDSIFAFVLSFAEFFVFT